MRECCLRSKGCDVDRNGLGDYRYLLGGIRNFLGAQRNFSGLALGFHRLIGNPQRLYSGYRNFLGATLCNVTCWGCCFYKSNSNQYRCAAKGAARSR
jgi:hypothetical protein